MAEAESSGRSPDIFISYASRDRDRVLPIVERLEAAGVPVWIDREGISGGASYALEIAEAIEQAKAIVLMCSEASLSSRNVKQEIALGWRFEKPYLPLLLEAVEIPKDVAYWLEAAQWVEVLDRPESEWLPKLAEALARLGIESHLTASSTRRARPLLVGREREQAILSEHLDRMLAGQGSVMLVGGEAGIGKTTLVEDLSVRAEEAGALVLWGHAYDLSVTPPYGPWMEIYRRYRVLDAGLPPLPSFIFNPEELIAAGSQDTLFTTTAEFFHDVATNCPLLLVLDDFHWFDQASLDFFRFLARQVGDQQIMMVTTYRSDELHRRHPLYTLLPLLVREAGAERVDVRPLTEAGHRALIESRYRLTEQHRARLERYLEEHAEGNPLYAGELLRTLEEEGALVAAGEDRWQLGDLEQVRVPPLLRQVIEGRLARLPETTRELLDVAAIIGQDVAFDLWANVAGASEDTLLEAAEAAVQAAVLLLRADGSGVQFRHALLREALYENVLPLRRRVWHRQTAEALAATHAPDPDQVAYHYQQAGDARAVDWLIRAGERARRAYVWSTAAERFDAALARMAEQQAPALDQVAVLCRLAYTVRYSVPRRSSLLLREARRLAEAAGERVFAAGCLVDDGLYQFFTGEMRDGLLAMAQGVEELDSVSDKSRTPLVSQYGLPELEFAAGSLVLALALVGRLHEAVQLGEQQIVPATPPAASPGSVGGSPYADGWFGLATAYALLGRPELAQQMLAQARSVYQAIEHYFILGSTYLEELKLIQLPFAADQPAADLRRLADNALSAGRRAKSAIPANLSIETFILPLLLLRGNWGEAKAAATPMYTLEPHLSLTASETLAPLAWAQGDGVLFNRILGDLLAAGPATEPGNTYLHAALLLQRLAARMAVETGDLPTAHAWLEAHDRWLAWSGAVLGRAEGALGWAEYHHANNDPVSARAAAERALAHASDPRQPLALLAVQRFLGTLNTEAAAFDASEKHLIESLRLAEACSSPFERALTLLEIARLRIAEGNETEAGALLAEVRAISEPLGAKPTLDHVANLERMLDSAGQGPHHV